MYMTSHMLTVYDVLKKKKRMQPKFDSQYGSINPITTSAPKNTHVRKTSTVFVVVTRICLFVAILWAFVIVLHITGFISTDTIIPNTTNNNNSNSLSSTSTSKCKHNPRPLCSKSGLAVPYEDGFLLFGGKTHKTNGDNGLLHDLLYFDEKRKKDSKGHKKAMWYNINSNFEHGLWKAGGVLDSETNILYVYGGVGDKISNELWMFNLSKKFGDGLSDESWQFLNPQVRIDDKDNDKKDEKQKKQEKDKKHKKNKKHKKHSKHKKKDNKDSNDTKFKDEETDNWPLIRGHCMALDESDKNNKKIYMFGGKDKDSIDQNWLWRLQLNDINSGWKKIHDTTDFESGIDHDSKYPAARHAFGCQMVQTKDKSKNLQFTIFGGRNRNRTFSDDYVFNYFNDLWSYDLFTNKWQIIDENNINNDKVEPRAHLSTFTIGDKNDNIVIVGGKNETLVSNNVWKFDFNLNEWQQLASLPENYQRYESSAISSKDGKMGYLFGGQTNIQFKNKQHNYLRNDVLVYHAQKNEWKILQKSHCQRAKECTV